MRSKLSAILLVSVLLFSCTEKTQVNLVTGTLFLDCENRLANFEIALKANSGGNFTAPIILGSAITKQDGSFNFTYELEEEDTGTGDLILIRSTGFETLISNVDLNENLQLVLYRNDLSSVEVQLDGTRNYNPTDTLFYGILSTDEESFKVQPTNGVLDTLIVPLNTPNQNPESTQLYYGIGSAEFANAKEAASISDSTFQNIEIQLNGCAEKSTVTMSVN